MRASEEKYRRFFEENLAGYYVTSPEGRLLECNPAFLRMFGFTSREEALDWDVAALYPNPESRKAFVDFVKVQGRLEQYSTELRTKDGRPIHVIENAVGEFNGAAELVEIRGYLIDDTERRKTEEQFRQAQKLEAIGTLAGGMAHDFNNLLTVITGYSNLLLTGIPPADPRWEQVSQIKAAGERAAALTNQILAFSRKQILQPKALNLNEVVTHMETMLRRLIGEDIVLTTILQPSLGTVRADAIRVEQVIMNLAVNARDAMPEGGRLVIQTENVEVGGKPQLTEEPTIKPGAYVMLAVSDSGLGMDEKTRSQIFEPFFTTKELGRGTGLGLSTVHGIVKQSGGHVEVSSAPGEGATFRIYLPRINEAPSPLAAEHPEEESEARPDTILVVEDDEAVRALLQRILAGKGYTLLVAKDPGEAIQIHKQHAGRIDLLLTDIVLPRMSGRKLAEELTAARPQLKVIYITGHTDGPGSPQEPAAGGALLQKPFTPAALLRQVRQTLLRDTTAGRILIVDDHGEIRRFERQVLEEAGYQVVEASDGAEALARLDESRFDLLITDLYLSGQNGGDLVRTVRARHPHLELIVISGAFEQVNMKPSNAYGVSGLLPKPITPDVLADSVRKVLGAPKVRKKAQGSGL